MWCPIVVGACIVKETTANGQEETFLKGRSNEKNNIDFSSEVLGVVLIFFHALSDGGHEKLYECRDIMAIHQKGGHILKKTPVREIIKRTFLDTGQQLGSYGLGTLYEVCLGILNKIISVFVMSFNS